ncbi:hypothetical protein K0M31_019049 [Melipona bicolor]|uniref:MADF domain-containing protein n=1 Tax=Melipona bicolor TaxID=60889 RepID=A0AA40FCK0_9HYME|nr:hypothetical protein K0M31_019049 [Melipona bicolor]
MYILQQMREEFPTIMANVHYRVLKKKWSNLMQQYKELKHPVHGDRNEADDVSWPYYNAIDEILGYNQGSTPTNDVYIDPYEFLCLSVTPEEITSSMDVLPAQSAPEIELRTNDSLPEQRLKTLCDNCSIEIQKVRPSNASRHSSHCEKQTSKNSVRKKQVTRNVAMLPRTTELTIEKVTSEADCSKDLFRLRGMSVSFDREDKERSQRDEIRPRKSRKSRTAALYSDDRRSRTDRRIEQIFEYIKKRDEEDRSIMVRVMHAVENIANKL